MTGSISPDSDSAKKRWIKSSHSNAGGSCVEVCFDHHVIMVRDSKDKRTDQPMLSIGAAQWQSFLTAVVQRDN